MERRKEKVEEQKACLKGWNRVGKKQKNMRKSCEQTEKDGLVGRVLGAGKKVAKKNKCL